jgi:chemotaxis family two-component system response regulator PixG
MKNLEMDESQKLLDEFKNCTRLQYNGRLNIKSSQGRQWNFYYRLGRIVWASGGTHPFRRWRRYMAQYASDIDLDKIRCRTEDIAISYWDYNLLEIFHKRQKIQREQIQAIAENTISELFFDLAQEVDFYSINCNRFQDAILEMPMSFTSADISIKMMQDMWAIWTQSGLTNISPNSAPVLRKTDQLQKIVSPVVYKNFINLVNGKLTLRELAVKMKQDVLPVARSLLPYILKGIIELVDLPDLPLNVVEPIKPDINHNARKQGSPLIACVDDSPVVCSMLEKIIVANGMRFVKVQDPVQALPTLIQAKPDLIFLDLIMPVVNGYEICSQLRRIPAFASIPIIILTGNDGLLDRVRAKVTGSTDFISKPIVADRVTSIVYKYLNLHNAPTDTSFSQLKLSS